MSFLPIFIVQINFSIFKPLQKFKSKIYFGQINNLFAYKIFFEITETIDFNDNLFIFLNAFIRQAVVHQENLLDENRMPKRINSLIHNFFEDSKLFLYEFNLHKGLSSQSNEFISSAHELYKF